MYLTLKLCGMEDIDSEPSDVDSLLTDDDRRQYLADVCRRVVQHVWMLPALSEIIDVTELDVDDNDKELFASDDWCICGEGSHIQHTILSLQLCTVQAYSCE